jgi:fatty acid amide hydrolase 2
MDGRTEIGPMATNVADVAAALGVIAGPDGVDPACCPVPVGDVASARMDGLRIAVLQPDERWPVGATTSGAVDRAMVCLVQQGAIDVGAVVPLDLSESLDITQRYWMRAGLTGAECEQQLGD